MNPIPNPSSDELIKAGLAKGKYCLLSNSHALSNFQECEMQYLLRDVALLAKDEEVKKHFRRGLSIGKILEMYYYRKLKGRSTHVFFNNLNVIFDRFMAALPDDPDHARRMYGAIIDYLNHYRREEIEVLGVEKAFSKVIYEDDENYFVYEGRPDLIAKWNGKTVIWDHKTQKSKSYLYPYNNQAMGYCWGLDALQFGYNFIVLTKETQFRREITTYSESQIEQWKQDTIKWFFKIKQAKTSQEYARSWQCQGKYGTCDFTPICEAPTDESKLWIVKSQFVQLEKTRMSW